MTDFTPDDFKAVLGRFATGVTVVSTRLGGLRAAITVNAFASVSLDPPLVLICIERAAHIHDMLVQAGIFAVNILSATQADLADCFARSSELRNRDLCGCGLGVAATGAPILKGTMGFVDCRITEVYPGGDHSIIVGHVEAVSGTNADPLIYFRRNYGVRGDR
ncbi:MAG TPA: flavin reductase family protein [Ktedonobacterales bacterium]